jgi:uncharacterized membrane protein
MPLVRLELVWQSLIWALFFASSLYGHIALKLAVNQGNNSYSRAMVAVATSFWGWSTLAAWGISCLLWMLVISKQKLLIASSISSFSYVLICIACWLFLGERLTWQQYAGVVLIIAGILLVK